MAAKNIQLLLLLVLFAGQYVVEHHFAHAREHNNRRHELYNIKLGLLNLVINFLPATGLINLLSWIEVNNIGLLQQIHLPLALDMIVTVVLMDLWMYCWHRLNHTVPLLWRFHRLHHTDAHMNTTTAVRFHAVELLLSAVPKAAVFCILGASFISIAVYETLFFAAIVFHHSNIAVTEGIDRWYRSLFASPYMHRTHHSVKKEERNSNYGSVFSFWDRLFHTYHQPHASVPFGVNEHVQDRDPAGAMRR